MGSNANRGESVFLARSRIFTDRYASFLHFQYVFFQSSAKRAEIHRGVLDPVSSAENFYHFNESFLFYAVRFLVLYRLNFTQIKTSPVKQSF